MQLFIEIYGFLSVVLRGFILAAQSVAVGGLAFLLLLVWPLGPRLAGAGEALERRALRLIFLAASGLLAAELLAAAALTAMLVGTLEIPAQEAAGARAVAVALVAGVIATIIAVSARRAQRGGAAIRRAAPVLAALLIGVQAGSTHAASQFDGAAVLACAEFLHMAGAAVWIGGIPYFLMALTDVADSTARARVAARFSAMSVGAVAALLAGGGLMAVSYVGAAPAMYGTSYGVMLSAKIVLLLGLLLLGGLNFLAVRKLRQEPAGPLLRTRRFAETEIGVGLTVLFCAASLASLPPARDLANNQASFAEIVDRLEPRLPVRLDSPDFEALSAALPPEALKNLLPGAQPPRSPADIAWSEYNHHWAGLFVIAMGVMALLERVSRRLAPVMRHWPLVFVGLAGFLFLRADEAVWPLGRLGLIESLRDPEIAQHRLLTLLIVIFGLFEWQVRQGRIKAWWAAYVFPVSTATAAAFLLTHSHALANLKEETLIEITHTPLALVGVAAGWSRWLELRLDGGAKRMAGFVWPIGFILAGLMLVFYREA
ncbi:CopD family protein [Methylocystis sp. MJC1]|jgi:putative copper resistance protein D|uniref:copper resistance D family protein n=1 Tax=Methylocystis sp. MJC1 TaxID=2654282 RepID=UPI0013EA2139|nr:CopD family protein [Methylocystis sp. MJC1]KAF2989759.1 Copper transport protein YcnJ [Methylocystis sp. MJC1]MBU6526352.1 CopD family protein [Methylocystis sp. MJC1]UZX12801.1 CopD family protein [Methylocystis sp. MJC1]